MRYSLRFLLFLRLFLRVFAFSYPLFLTVMYNFWIFEKLPTVAWWGYIALMAILEIIIASGRLPLKPLLTAYMVIAAPLELPSVFLGGVYIHTALVFLPWVALWYGSLLLLIALNFPKTCQG
ncbi:hypothetical protein [Thermococcus sp. 21S7]|uniref:hypothetical protein n=1 Tax=Thermococcus sp. 21S7 TaxID=1638221 RepID=UPI001438BC0C|nr:hypothetical protein [Thermococcus sp. 21S7]NJE61864.1 hypothetical protein [Thermococcus sp. 21S7]